MPLLALVRFLLESARSWREYAQISGLSKVFWTATESLFTSSFGQGANHCLLALPNALCTPHLGYVEHDNHERYFGMAFEQINAYAATLNP